MHKKFIHCIKRMLKQLFFNAMILSPLDVHVAAVLIEGSY
jgi:hypothetical protein